MASGLVVVSFPQERDWADADLFKRIIITGALFVLVGLGKSLDWALIYLRVSKKTKH